MVFFDNPFKHVWHPNTFLLQPKKLGGKNGNGHNFIPNLSGMPNLQDYVKWKKVVLHFAMNSTYFLEVDIFRHI